MLQLSYKYSQSLIIILALFFGTGGASFGVPSIQAEGVGIDYEAAIEDALATAVGMANGALVVGVTVSDQGQLIKDKISSVTAGRVSNYKIVERDILDNGFIRVKLKVDLEQWSSERALKPAPEGMVKFEENISALQGHQTASIQLIQEFLGSENDLLERGYQLDTIDVVLHEVGPFSLSGEFLVQVTPDMDFWMAYQRILNSIDFGAKRNRSKEGLFGRLNIYSPGCLGCVGIDKSAPSTNDAIQRFMAQPLRANIVVGESKKPIILYKNAVVLSESDLDQPVEQNVFEGNHVLLAEKSTLQRILHTDQKLFDRHGLQVVNRAHGLYSTVSGRSLAVISDHHEVLIRVPFRVNSIKELNEKAVFTLR